MEKKTGKESEFAKKAAEAIYNKRDEYKNWTEKGMWKRYHDAVEKGDVNKAAKVLRTLEEENFHNLVDRMLKATGADKAELDRLFKNYQSDDDAYQSRKISYDEWYAAGDIGKPSAVEVKEKTNVHKMNERYKSLPKFGRAKAYTMSEADKAAMSKFRASAKSSVGGQQKQLTISINNGTQCAKSLF